MIAKVLANRLNRATHSTTSDFQSAFIARRQILDPILIANEIVEEYRTKNPARMGS